MAKGSILHETQLDRDKELAYLLNMKLEDIQKLPIATPDALRISDGTKPKNLEDLYRDYKYLNFPAYLRTLMKTSATRRHPELFKFLKATKNKNCLDFGSGVGTHAIALAENNNTVTLLDVEGSQLLHFATRRLMTRKHLNFDILYHNEELPKENFDVVICTDVLEHVNDPMKEIERIKNTLKIGGVLHLLVSGMIKPSSGHFRESIEKWRMNGDLYLQQYFKKIGLTLYQRIK